MASHRAMKTLAEDGAGVRALARSLLLMAHDWTDWECEFLDNMATRDDPDPLSMRQREILSELKAAAERHSKIDGFGVPGLIASTWEARLDLDDEDDIAFIEALRASGARTVTGRQKGRLLRLARAVGIIEHHHAMA